MHTFRIRIVRGIELMATGMAKEAMADTTTDESWPPPQGEWTYEDCSRLPGNGLRYAGIKVEWKLF